jgi:hypothetical protein
MPITQNMVARVLATAAATFPAAVVTCTHSYTAGGSTRPQTFSAIRGTLSAQQNIAITGSATTASFTLTIDLAAVDFVTPLEGDRITVRRGDDAATEHTVIMRGKDPLDAVLVLTVGPKHG